MLKSRNDKFLCFNHLRSCSNEVDMTAPEGFPGHFPFLYSQDEKLKGPE